MENNINEVNKSENNNHIQIPQEFTQEPEYVQSEVAGQSISAMTHDTSIDTSVQIANTSNDNKIFGRITRGLHITLQSIILLAFITGIAAVNGQTVNILNFFYEIIDLFKLNAGNWYYYIASCAQGVTYLIVVISLIIQYVKAIGYWRYGLVETLRAYSSEMFKLCFIYFIVMMAIKTTTLTSFGLIALIVSIILMALCILTENRIKSKITLEFVLRNPVVFLIKCIALVLIINFVMFDCFAQVINGFVTLASINYEKMDGFIYIIFESLGNAIIGIVCMCLLLSLSNNIFFGDQRFQYEAWRKLMIFFFVVFGLEMIFYLAFSTSRGDTVEKIFDFIKTIKLNVLPCIFISVGSFILSYNLKPEDKKKVLNTPAGQIKY